MSFNPAEDRYARASYKRCGRSGVQLPPISLGLWQNFGSVDGLDNCRSILRRAFDCGITHFDLANNYGPPAGTAEATFGRILREDLAAYRDELIISTKAGYLMWPGPYGEGGSRKYLIASLDQSLKRMGLEYVDIFYSHRPDPSTPLEETMGALDHAVRRGKALYAGISNYNAAETAAALKTLRGMGTPCLIHQAPYSMFRRQIEEGLTGVLENESVGLIVFSPLARGLLTDRYLNGIPAGSRAEKSYGFVNPQDVEARLPKVRSLDALARERGQSLSQMAIAWVLRLPQVTSALIGVSSVEQLDTNLDAVKNLAFSQEELGRIDAILRTTNA